jgi:hypothetical protein
MAQIFGDYQDQPSKNQEHLTIVFSPSSGQLQERWYNNGLSADFMADYFSTFFPRGEESISGINSKAEVKNIVSFIANELLENAMKFSDRTLDYPISITLQLQKNGFVFFATNSVVSQSVSPFQDYIQKLLNSDPGELIVHQLEKNAEDKTNTGSGLGILTLMSDYLAKVGWKFETVQDNPNITTVTTMVYLTI